MSFDQPNVALVGTLCLTVADDHGSNLEEIDADDLRSVLAGERRACTTFVRRYQRVVYAALWRMLATHERGHDRRLDSRNVSSRAQGLAHV